MCTVSSTPCARAAPNPCQVGFQGQESYGQPSGYYPAWPLPGWMALSTFMTSLCSRFCPIPLTDPSAYLYHELQSWSLLVGPIGLLLQDISDVHFVIFSFLLISHDWAAWGSALSHTCPVFPLACILQLFCGC